MSTLTVSITEQQSYPDTTDYQQAQPQLIKNHFGEVGAVLYWSVHSGETERLANHFIVSCLHYTLHITHYTLHITYHTLHITHHISHFAHKTWNITHIKHITHYTYYKLHTLQITHYTLHTQNITHIIYITLFITLLPTCTEMLGSGWNVLSRIESNL